MTTRRNDVKKSEFVATTTINPTDTFDFVVNGQNKKITFANLITALGALGVLQTKGSVSGAPVLDISGGVSYIRNLEAGNGIQVAVSGTDGVEVGHNLSFDNTGAQLCVNPSVASPVFRSLVAGAGMTVVQSGNTIQFTATGITVASNIVIVNSMSDFPAPVAGIRTLADDTAYLVSADLTTSDRFVMGNNCVVYGADSAVCSLSYTGSAAMFTAANVNSKITLITLNAPSGTLFDISGTNANIFQFINSSVISCDEIGDFDGMGAVQITDVSFANIITNGMTFTNGLLIFVGTRNLFVIKGGTLFDLGTATFVSGFSLETSFIQDAAGTTFMDGLIDSGNMLSTALGTVFNCRLAGLGTALNNIAFDDARWEFLANDLIPNSRSSLLATHAGATITISVINTPVVVGATWVIEEEHRFSGTAAGRFTYTGVGASVSIHATITAEVAASSDDCTFYIAINGVVQANSGIQRTLTSGSPGNLGLIWAADLETNDYVEIFVENNDGTTNVVLVKASLRID